MQINKKKSERLPHLLTKSQDSAIYKSTLAAPSVSHWPAGQGSADLTGWTGFLATPSSCCGIDWAWWAGGDCPGLREQVSVYSSADISSRKKMVKNK